jgi:putative protease
VQLQTDETLRVGDEVMVIGETTGVYRATIQELRTDRDPVPEVHQGDRFSFKIEDSSPSQGEVAAGRRGVHRGDKVYRIDKLIDEF